MPPEELGSTLVSVTELAAQVMGLQLRLLARAERVGVGQEVSATSAAKLADAPVPHHPPGRASSRSLRTLSVMAPEVEVRGAPVTSHEASTADL
jgi:hypothetical protein